MPELLHTRVKSISYIWIVVWHSSVSETHVSISSVYRKKFAVFNQYIQINRIYRVFFFLVPRKWWYITK